MVGTDRTFEDTQVDKKDLQLKIVGIEGRMNDLMAKAKTEKRELTQAEGEQYDAMVEERAGVRKNIDRLIAHEESTGEKRGLNTSPNAHIDPSSEGGENPLGVSQRDLSRYSISRALRCLLNNKAVDGLEGEISREMEKRTGQSAKGFYVYSAPSFAEARAARAAMEQRADLTTSTGVGGLNQTVLYSSFIELLRHKTLTDKLGVTFMAGLNGKILIPRQATAASTYWLGEEGTPTASAQTLDQVTLNPNTVGCFTDISRQFINQTSMDAESFVRNDLAKIMALEIDRVAFAGTGSSSQPTGVLNASGLTVNVAAADSGNGGALAWGDLVGLETTVAAADADTTNMVYVTNPKQRGKLKQVLRNSVAGASYIWDDENTINGYNAMASNQISSALTKGSGTGLSPVILGDWSSMMIGLWGGLDVTVDPYSRSTAGVVRIVALQDVDIELRHVASFVALTAATN
jgi:HK97 family phage major capsid protein